MQDPAVVIDRGRGGPYERESRRGRRKPSSATGSAFATTRLRPATLEGGDVLILPDRVVGISAAPTGQGSASWPPLHKHGIDRPVYAAPVAISCLLTPLTPSAPIRCWLWKGKVPPELRHLAVLTCRRRKRMPPTF